MSDNCPDDEAGGLNGSSEYGPAVAGVVTGNAVYLSLLERLPVLTLVTNAAWLHYAVRYIT
jgi:hypothetical protein